MHFLSWKDNSKLFLIEKNTTYSYGDLYQAISKTRKNISGHFLLPTSFILESENSFESYVRFLSLLFEGHSVLLTSKTQFADQNYIDMIAEEAKSTFVNWAKVSEFPGRFDASLSKSRAPATNNWEQAHFLVRTSGSSGKKFKLVFHKLSNFIQKYQNVGKHFLRTFAFSPAESIAGIETLLEVITHELSLVSSIDDLSPSTVVTLIQEQNVDYFQTTPTYMNLLMMTGQVSNEKLSNLKKIAFGSEPSQKAVLEFYIKNVPQIKLVHTYGMSEIGIQKTITSEVDPSFFSIDTRYAQARVVDGLLEIKTDTKMIRYLNYEEAASSLGDGWFRTYDQVLIQGVFMKVLGREGDLINIAGRKFFPYELENQLMELPDVFDVTISTEKNEMIGTVIVANIIIGPDVDELIFRTSLKIFCQENIVHYMHPHKIRIKREIELTTRLKKMRNI